MSIHHHHHLLLLLKLPSQTHSPLSQSLLLNPQTTLNSHTTLLLKSNHFLVPLCRSSRWDPNAESFINKNLNFNFKKNGSGKSAYFYEDGEEDDDELESVEVWDAVLEEYIDSIWILKVFGSYGWFLPLIILSILLASGLKAFLLALTLPLAQSTIWFLFQKIWGGTDYTSRRKMKSKRKSSVRGSSASTAKRGRKEKRAYPSWVPRKDVSGDNWGNDGGSSFGGWDELDSGRDFTKGSPISDQRAGRSQGRHSKKDNFGRVERTSDTPLLLRLLIGVFPFLSWWIKLF